MYRGIGSEDLLPFDGELPLGISYEGTSALYSSPVRIERPNLMPPLSDPQLGMISQVPIFQTLSKKHLRSIADAGKRLSYDPGEKIVSKGEEGSALYLILDGLVAVRSGNRVLANLGKGNFFGEIALFDRQPRSADIVAVSPTTCLGITAASFERILQKEPKIVLGINRELARRLRNADVALTE